MRARAALACVLVALFALPVPVFADGQDARGGRREGSVLPPGFRPAATRLDQMSRYFVQLKAAAMLERGGLPTEAQRSATDEALRAQRPVIAQAEALGGRVIFRYGRVVNAFSVDLTLDAALELSRRADVRQVEPVGIVRPALESSVPFIGATRTWRELGVRGKGVTVAVIDSGVDYTHADFGGPGTVRAYESNDPTVIEPGTFPTAKVIGGFDFAGDAGFDPGDDDPTNDVPSPDPDPLDWVPNGGSHGTHVAGICCGRGVPGEVPRGVAPAAKILALKVFDVGASTTDVSIAAYEFAIDPNQDGSTDDAVDVINLSLGDDYSYNFVEQEALEAVDDAGTVVVAAAGNAGNQPSGGSAYIGGSPGNAPTAIGVASSIDELEANVLTVDSPAGVDLPERGLAFVQDWAAPLDADLTGDIVDAREVDPPADPAGVPADADRQLCDVTPSGQPFAGRIALVYKGSTANGDCDGSEKVFRAQEAGAVVVILWSGFTGPPFALAPGEFAELITIPAVMVSGADGAALAASASPNAPGAYNEETVTVTIGSAPEVVPGFADRLSDFSSEGPARVTSALKPDVTAPGDAITSASAGTGTGSLTIGGTSMATPHVAGVAALLREIHPTWSPARIKALIMNQATNETSNADGSGPVPATVQGAGRIQAYESAVSTNLVTPGSVSFGLQGVSDFTSVVKDVRLQNLDSKAHRYQVSADVRYTDFARRFVSVQVSVNDEQLADSHRFTLRPGQRATVFIELTLDPATVPQRQQLFGWYFFNPNVDGSIHFQQLGRSGDAFHVPWHAAALASANTTVRPSSLDLTDGTGELKVVERGAGLSHADLYLLGAESAESSSLEEDIAAIGARSFTGATIDGVAEGIPTGADKLVGLTWQDFMTLENVPTEPVEFVVATHGVRNTTETLEVDLLLDVGADGVFADPQLQADVMIVKLPEANFGTVCVYLLPSDLSECDATYFPDYSNYNSNVLGIVVDASTIGLSDADHVVSYGAIVCSGTTNPDAPPRECDEITDIDPVTGTYDAVIDVTDPALHFSPMVVRGFWQGDPGPVTVTVGSAQPGDDPSILAVFANNAPGDQTRIIATTT